MKTKNLTLAGLTILLASSLVACSNGESSNSESKDTVKTEKKEKKTTVQKNQLGLTKSQNDKFNSSLIDGLNEDQGYASSGDDSYSWAQYIDTLVYDNNRGLIIKVTSDFTNFSEKDKNTIAGNAVGLAEAQLAIMGKNDSGTKTIHSNVYMENTKLGSSKFSNPREFKWK
ncbi:hypothetical protein [Companilactobacillus kimchiensis]|uniref:Lipoprotein n=1 Tax=Companilactobacillus kimchiensis TaxID=993692 RepID=A0A0R2LP91_9LACO|nr:hypothetical protein [Companilactobacillus kimchiensis]KRO00925.1 hypothetical protein IV57_GL000251 [Companilactobacillus kimchiensis]